MTMNARERDILIRTIIGEADGEDDTGQRAVAHVIRNRLASGKYGESASAVALQPKQFSAWNSGEGGNGLVKKYGPGTPQYERAAANVDAVFSGGDADPTGGAVNYFAPQGMGDKAPSWFAEASAGKKLSKLGNHVFIGGDEAPAEASAQTAPASPVDWGSALKARKDGATAAPTPEGGNAPANDWSAALKQRRASKVEPEQSSGGPQRTNLATKVNQDGSPPNMPNKGDLLAMQGVLMGGADEALSAIAAPVASLANRMGLLKGDALPGVGDNYDQGKALLRATEARFREEHPNYALANELGGAVATAPLIATKALQGGSMVAKVAKGTAAGATMSAANAALSNDGTLEERARAALEQAPTGAGVGAATPIAGKAIGAGVRALKSSSAYSTLAQQLGVSVEAAKKLLRATSDDLASGSLKRGDKADMLMNLGDQLGEQAGAIATIPGKSQSILAEAIRKQKSGAGARVKETVDRTIGTDKTRVANAAEVEAERKAAGKMYEVAKQHAQPLNARKALYNLADSIDAADGDIRTTLEGLRKLRVFDESKAFTGVKASDVHSARQVVDDAIRAAGPGTNKARLLQGVRRDLDAILQKVPGYKEADAAYSVAIKSREALEDGRKVFSRGYGSPDELQQELSKMAPEVRDKFTRGARDYVSELMGTARNDAGAVIRELNEKGWNQEKLAVLIGQGRADHVARSLEKEARRQGLANTVLGNSKTAKTLAAQKEFANPADSKVNGNNLRGATVTGLALEGVARGWNALRNQAKTKTAQEVNAQVATLLTKSGVERDKAAQILVTAARRKQRALTALERVDALIAGLGINVNAVQSTP